MTSTSFYYATGLHIANMSFGFVCILGGFPRVQANTPTHIADVHWPMGALTRSNELDMVCFWNVRWKCHGGSCGGTDGVGLWAPFNMITLPRPRKLAVRWPCWIVVAGGGAKGRLMKQIKKKQVRSIGCQRCVTCSLWCAVHATPLTAARSDGCRSSNVCQAGKALP